MNFKNNARMNTPITVFIAKLFPICFFARKKKGIFITKIKIGRVNGVKKLKSKEIPVTPPSIKPLGSKNPLSPNATKKTPKSIVKDSFKELYTLLFSI